ncbi:MAG: hypothetical protein JWQ46_1549 [Phenylobacterium sp.]|nr:hypothetical protein [Phenylobacterium sp.]
MTMAMLLKPTDAVEGQFAAYNAQDLEAFCSFYGDDAVLGGFNEEPHTRGLAAIRTRHEKLFAEFPQNKAVLLHRLVVGDTIIDHERVFRSPEAEPFEVAAIYTLAGGKVARVDFVK